MSINSSVIGKKYQPHETDIMLDRHERPNASFRQREELETI